MTPSSNSAAIYWFPIADAIGKPREEWPDWTLIAVDITVGVDINERLRLIRDLSVADAFTIATPGVSIGVPPAESPAGVVAATPANIATPTSSPSVVESPGGGDARTAHAASPSPTLERWAADIGDNPAGATLDAEAHAEIVATVRNHRQAPTLDDLRASIDHWTDADKANLRALMVANGVDRTDSDEVSKAIIDYHFHDVATQPVAPAVAPVMAPPTTPTDPDEGPDADERALGALEGRYKALDAAGLSWVGGIVTGAQRANTPFHLKVSAGGKRTVRRFEILRGLVSLAAGGFDNDDAVRACLVHAIGAELADSLSFELGRLVGCMGATEAAVFADVAVTLAEGGGSMRWLDDGRCRVEAVAA